MRIIAIDPGYERLGIAVLGKLPHGKEVLLYSACAQTPKALPHAERLLRIANNVRKVIAEWKPQALAIETLFLAVNQKTAMPVAEARGAVLVEAARAGLSVFEYTPLQIKIAVTGYGKSDKKQVMEMVKRLVEFPEKSLPPQTGYSLLQRENKSLHLEDSGAPFSAQGGSVLRRNEGRMRLDDEYDAIAVGLTCLASVKRINQ